MDKSIDDILEIYSGLGDERYGNESISQLAHGLQCALLAENEGAAPSLVVAALLHDIGHLVDKKFDVGQENEIDRHHEDIGAAYLASCFSADVTEPIRLHVPAKRYLCRVDDGYEAGLSDASVRSLRLQGGTFSESDAADFIKLPFAEDAVRLRRWDEEAKVPGLATPPIEHYVRFMEAVHVGSAA